MIPNWLLLFREVAVPLLTIVASGVVASAVTFKLNARLQRRHALRTKLEEAFAASHVYCTRLGNHFLKYFRVFKGDLDINHANELTIKEGEGADTSSFWRLEMLVTIYVPSALPPFRRLLALREHLNDIVANHKQRYLRGEPVTLDLVPQLSAKLQELDRIERELKDAIIHQARQL